MRRDLVWLRTALQNLQRFDISNRVGVVEIGNKQVGYTPCHVVWRKEKRIGVTFE
jgi:hypothetical protein